MLVATSSSRDQRAAVSARRNCVAAAQRRNGTSLTTSTAIRPPPHGSCVVAQAGGASKPVAHGENARSNQPLGAIKKASPMANAACGTASIGASALTMRSQRGPGKLSDNSSAANATASAVAARPVQSVIISAGGSCGSLHRAFHASVCSAAPAADPTTPREGTAIIAASNRAGQLKELFRAEASLPPIQPQPLAL